MRLASALAAAVLLASAGAASAQTLQPISFSPAFQEKLDDELGEREGAYLRRVVDAAITRAFERRGLSREAARMDISIVDADPNRPTMAQGSARPGLDMMRSVSIGGAELRAVLYGAEGRVLTEIEHRYYTHSLNEVFHPTTWTDAHRSIRRFAEKVADAYASVG